VKKSERPSSPPAPPSWNLDRTLLPAAVGLASVFATFEYTSIDLWLQDRFFDFERMRWLVDGSARLPRLLFYQSPKILLVLFGLGILLLAAVPTTGWRERFGAAGKRRSLWVVFATLATGPALIGLGKATTNIFCPYEIERYGGDVAYVRVLDCTPPGSAPARRGRCFPAGHASGGFALLALAGLGRSRRSQVLGAALGMGAGLWMGLYQILKGAHYLSHTVITAFVLWIVFLLWRRILQAAKESDGAARTVKDRVLPR